MRYATAAAEVQGLMWLVLLLACGLAGNSGTGAAEGDSASAPSDDPIPSDATGYFTDVVGVTVGGDSGAYVFSVSLEGHETGCDRYADWWELLTPQGDLIYRRILQHSHATTQPFTRSGEPVDLAPESEVVVRGHMHPDGYGGLGMQGSAAGGFRVMQIDPGFALGVEALSPQPESCLY